MNDLYRGLAEILEVDAELINPSFDLHSGGAAWDSLAVVSTIALIDEVFSVMVDGQSLGKCTTVANIEALVEGAQKR